MENGKASIDDDRTHLRWLHGKLYGRHLDEVDKLLVDSIRKARKSDGVSNSTVNRMLEILRGILRMSVEQGWLQKAPTVKMLPKPKLRVRWLSKSEESRLMDELPTHLAEMAHFSLATGLRASNVTGLEWSQVDLAEKRAWIHADQSKSGKGIAVPLNASAIEVLKRQVGKHETRVFTYFAKSVAKANTRAWRNALRRAGITNFRWHDLRHTWASRHIRSGTPLHVLKELGGWASYEMVLRYAHLAPQHLAEHAERIVDRGTISGTVEKEATEKVAA